MCIQPTHKGAKMTKWAKTTIFNLNTPKSLQYILLRSSIYVICSPVYICTPERVRTHVRV